jgi:hypothetical protein
LGLFCRALEWNMMVYFVAMWYILRPFVCFTYSHLVHFVVIWCIYCFPFWYVFTEESLATLNCFAKKNNTCQTFMQMTGSVASISNTYLHRTPDAKSALRSC